jgi:Type II CAAX prenyl endopeptidase Rce1-like
LVSDRRPHVVLIWALLCGPLVFALLQLPAAAWTAMLGYHAGCLVVVRLAGGPHARTRFPVAGALGLLVGSALLVVACGAVARAWGLLPGRPVEAWSTWGVRPPFDLAWLAYYVAVNPSIEERFWRGALLSPDVRSRFGRVIPRLLSTIGFGIHHLVVLGASFGWSRGALMVLPIVAAAVVWVAWRERSGGLGPAIASHRGADLGLAILHLWIWRV